MFQISILKTIITTIFILTITTGTHAQTARGDDIPVKNYTNVSELAALKKLEQYIRGSAYLIENAQALSNPDARYKFNYDILIQDLSEIASAIDRSINQDKRSQKPRALKPLVAEY